jgi:hypothetical protein
MQKKNVIAALLIPLSVLAQECVVQEKMVNRTDTVITDISEIKRNVVPWVNNQKKCIVNFKAQIDGDWHLASGEFIWDGELPVADACGAAVKKAKRDLTFQVKPSIIISEDVLICNDDTRLAAVKKANVGGMIEIAQVRPHPTYPARFYHNGAECKMFLDSVWTGKDIRQYQGVACKVEPTKWVVVDKF